MKRMTGLLSRIANGLNLMKEKFELFVKIQGHATSDALVENGVEGLVRQECGIGSPFRTLKCISTRF